MQIAWGLVTDMGSVHQTAFLVGFSMPKYILFLIPLCTSFRLTKFGTCRLSYPSAEGVSFQESNIGISRLRGYREGHFFLPRDAMDKRRRPTSCRPVSVCLSVGPSVCMFYCIQTAKTSSNSFQFRSSSFMRPAAVTQFQGNPLCGYDK